MRYTTLRITERGVVLWHEHVRRLAPEGEAAVRALCRFAAAAAPGIYGLTADGGDVRVEVRPGSRLTDGMPVRFCRSPVADLRGPVLKSPSPSPYDAVRAAGVATLLTSRDAAEIYEACVAAVVGWEGSGFVLVPRDRPRVASVTEAAVRRRLRAVERPLVATGGMPLALMNAVKGICLPALPGRDAFPPEARRALEDLLEEETVRP